MEETAQKSAGFDNRVVSYEEIHKIDEKSKQALVDAVNPKPGNIILDGMSGYGAVTKWILENTKSYNFTPNIYTVDESAVQIRREEEYLPILPHDHIFQCDIRKTPFKNEFFDTVVIKMGVHELPNPEQSKIFAEIYRILKPGGKFIIWELSLTSENQKIFQDVIRKKDELAGFDEMVAKRYFPRYDELRKLFEDAGFKKITDCHNIIYEPSTLARKDELVSKERKELTEQHGELTTEDIDQLQRLSEQRVKEFTEFARTRIPEELREKLRYKDTGNDVSFQIDKIIMSGVKPLSSSKTPNKFLRFLGLQ